MATLADIIAPETADVDFRMDFRDEDIKVEKHYDPAKPDDLPVVSGVGSSELVDADGDIFHKSALTSLCLASEGMSTWMNHSFDVPDDLFGSLIASPALDYSDAGSFVRGQKMDNPFAVVRITSDVEMDNPAAARSYKFICKGRKLGWSVGCHYENYKRRSDNRGAIKGFDVYEVSPVEWSVVGLPSNPGSWIDRARKSLVRKGVIPARAEDFDVEVAYIFKHWSEFDDVTAVKLRRLAESLERNHGLVLAIPAERRMW